MSKSKIMKMSRDGISPNMMLLHLRWQQIRLELLQQAAHTPHHSENTPPEAGARKEVLATA
ncbi:MAG: hypothetical protein JSR17_01975 [Proteobacteria bacterium]|nr:hypothetical protein [Pseudomonadota bacterium]